MKKKDCRLTNWECVKSDKSLLANQLFSSFPLSIQLASYATSRGTQPFEVYPFPVSIISLVPPLNSDRQTERTCKRMKLIAGSSIPTERFIILEPKSPTIDVSELRNIRISSI